MMTDTVIQQPMDTNGHTLVTQTERQALIQKLNLKLGPDITATIEKHAYEKSRGVKLIYIKMIQNYYQQIQNTQQIRPTQPQQLINNNGQFTNQQINLPQQSSTSMINNHSQHQLNHLLNQPPPPPRFPSIQQTPQIRLANPSTTMISNPQQQQQQPALINQNLRLRDPQKFNQSSMNAISYTPTNSNIPTIDLSQINNSTLNDYLSSSQTSNTQNRYLNQSLINQRPRLTTNLNNNFSQPTTTTSNNSNDVLHQFVVGNPSTNTVPMTNTSSNGDRLLQQILLSNNDNSSNKISLPTRQSTPSIMPQPIRSSTSITNNNNLNPSVNPIRSNLTSQQHSPAPSVIIMPPSNQISNVQIQPSTNVTIQQSPLNNNSSQPSSVSINNYSSPTNRSTTLVNGNISSPDEETINLIKFFRENVTKLQALCQKFTNEGNLEKARNAQAIHQQMLQFITNPTYESLPNAKHIRDMLEKVSHRSQQPTVIIPPINEFDQFEKVLGEYFSRDLKRRLILNKLFVEPLTDVVNGVPHKKIRLDLDNNSNEVKQEKSSSIKECLLIKNLNNEFNLLPNNSFSIEFLPVSHTMDTIELTDEYLSKNGLIIRCKLLENSNPIIPILRLRISTRYPDEQPEILSLTKTMPPKLEFSDGHPFFEQLSTIFISHLFQLPSQHTITDILNIWYQSVRSAL